MVEYVVGKVFLGWIELESYDPKCVKVRHTPGVSPSPPKE
jgi:hypothetical protein